MKSNNLKKVMQFKLHNLYKKLVTHIVFILKLALSKKLKVDSILMQIYTK